MASADLIHVAGRVVLLFYMKFHALQWKQGGGWPSAHPLQHVHVMFMWGSGKVFSGDQSIHLPLSIPFFLWSVNVLLHLLCCHSVCFCAVILVFFLFVF